MCHFVSTVERRRHVYFLTHDLVYETEKGKLLREWCARSDDLKGHGAIRFYFGLEQDEGKNQEYTDFSSPANFPPIIATAIKQGKMRGIGYSLSLLNAHALAKHDSTCYVVVVEYKCVSAVSYAEYERIRGGVFWDIFAIPENRNPAWV